eukprot:6178157-Pleurochrysis_carterae.AAC.2
MTQGKFDSSRQCNNTTIISNSAFDMIKESSQAFGNIVALATMYMQARLGFKEALKPLRGGTDFGWHQDTDSVDR